MRSEPLCDDFMMRSIIDYLVISWHLLLSAPVDVR